MKKMSQLKEYMISRNAKASVINPCAEVDCGDERRNLEEVGKSEDLEIFGVPQRFRLIEPGTFLMGSPDKEISRHDGELQHEVTLTKGYWLGDTACTQALWETVMGENPSRFKGPNRPVECVSWNNVQRFLKKLNEKYPGQNFRLPTEAEWEYACRAGTTTPFSFGENVTTDQVNYDGDYPYNDGPEGKFRGKTVPVKSLPPNQWELYEMHGNVCELCSDRYGRYPSGPVTDPIGPDNRLGFVARGGCWDNTGKGVRSAMRRCTSTSICYDTGFRLARGLRQEGK